MLAAEVLDRGADPREVDGNLLRQAERLGYTRRAIGPEEILERCLLALANEGAKILEENIAAEARLMTDEHPLYKALGYAFASHGYTTHSKGEYVSRLDASVHTQRV